MRTIPVSKPCLGPAEYANVQSALRNNQLSMGPMVARFEAAFAEYLGTRHAVFTTSGTTALHLALAAAGIGPGHSVLVPDLTFVATANAVTYTGARVLLADISRDAWGLPEAVSYTGQPSQLSLALPVHLYGRACAVPTFVESIEDAAQALGGFTSWGARLGTVGQAAVFSFFGNKTLTTGEGGMVVTDHHDFAVRLRLLRGQGVDPARRYYHSVVGYNYRPTELAAAIGLGQLQHLNVMLRRRWDIVARYNEALSPLVGTPPCAEPKAAPWLYTFQVPPPYHRDSLARRLAAWGIETRPTFVPLHRLPSYNGLDDPGTRRWEDEDFPIASEIGDTGLSLPTYPTLTDEEVEYVIGAVQAELSEDDDGA